SAFAPDSHTSFATFPRTEIRVDLKLAERSPAPGRHVAEMEWMSATSALAGDSIRESSARWLQPAHPRIFRQPACRAGPTCPNPSLPSGIERALLAPETLQKCCRGPSYWGGHPPATSGAA